MKPDEELPSILVVDDDDRLRSALSRALTSRGHEVLTASCFDEAVAIARASAPEWVVVDLRMPGPSGLDLIRALVEIDPETRIVVLTGYGSIATTVEAMRLGAVHYLQKPADADDILAAFTTAPGQARAHVEDVEAPSLERVKWEHVNRVLSDCGGNISEAARKLKLHRRSLQRMLQKFPPRE